jgi:DNA-binding LytR/AlgR family response regulator
VGQFSVGANTLTLRSLQRFEETLDPRDFVRISRQYVVNVKHVDRTDIVLGGGMRIQLTNGATIQIARRRVEKFKEMYLLADTRYAVPSRHLTRS